MKHQTPGAAAAALLIALASNSSAQPLTVQAPTAAAAAPPQRATGPALPAPSTGPEASVAHTGMIVRLVIAEAISTRTLKRGDRFAIRLDEPISVGGRVVVPEGATGIGQVVDVGRGGMAGKAAKLVLAARYIEFNGHQIPLKAFRFGRSGADHTDEATIMMIAGGAVGSVIGLMMKGGEIDVASGAHGEAKLAVDLDLQGKIVNVAPTLSPAAAPPAAS